MTNKIGSVKEPGMQSAEQNNSSFGYVIFLLSLIFGFVAIASILSGCGSASDNNDFGVVDELEENQDDFVRPQFGSTTDEDPVFPDGRNPPPPSSGSGGSSSGGTSSSSVIFDFLWKPESERDGNVAVLVNPTNVSIRINGSEILSNTGPSNGRGTTGRGRRSGCEYGDNVVVEFFNSQGRKIPLKDGRDRVVISDGCDRVEFRL